MTQVARVFNIICEQLKYSQLEVEKNGLHLANQIKSSPNCNMCLQMQSFQQLEAFFL